MEQLPQVPIDFETSSQKVKETIANLDSSPKKFLGILVGISVLVALIFFGIFYLSQNLAIFRDKQDNNNQVKNDQKDNSTFDQQRSRDLRDIARSLRSYKVNYGEYPVSLDSLVPEFLFKMPLDPVTQKKYDYRPSVNRKSFELKARLANGDELIETGN